MARYLVIFTTPVAGGWETAYPEALAVVEDTDGTMPYGYQPEKIGDLYVQEIKYMVLIHDGTEPPFVVSGEYDMQVPLGTAPTIMQDDSFGPHEDADDGTADAAPIQGEYLTTDDVAPLDPEHYRKD